jgi:SAM-dependent methyltransferase
MLDVTNRIRNITGNYRYISHLMRLWRLQELLGFDSNRLERKLIARAAKGYTNSRPWTSIDLGCGDQPRNPFNADKAFGYDFRENQANQVYACNLAIEPIPLPENSIDFATAYDFVEHIPRIIVSQETRFPFIEFMSEVHRVLKPNGLFYSKTPAYPKNEAFQDPTHVNIITTDTFPYYFCWHPYGGPWGRLYGFKAKFELASQRWQGFHLLTVLRKI